MDCAVKNDNTAYLVIIFPKSGRIMDRLSAMALLVKVTELGSMSAAARALNTPLTTVSRNIGELESALGVRLLTRTTRKLTLTDAGVDYVAAARRILEEVENAERRATGEYQEPKGELVISAPTMFGRQHVLPVISEFIARYPQIRVRLLLSDSNADLVDDHIDLAVRIGELADSSMVATRLGAMRIVACAHPALLAKYGEPQRPRDLAALPIIRIESPMPYRGWALAWPACCTTRRWMACAAGNCVCCWKASSRSPRRFICYIPRGSWLRLSYGNLSILPRRRCASPCYALPGPFNAPRFSAAPPSIARKGQTRRP